MELKTINFLDTYNKVLKIEPEDVEEPAAVEQDLVTNFSEEQISDFLCEYLSLDLFASPYSVYKDHKLQKQNQVSFKTNCHAYSRFNETNNNTVAHFSFNNTNDYGDLSSSFDENFSKNNITFNRTDTNI